MKFHAWLLLPVLVLSPLLPAASMAASVKVSDRVASAVEVMDTIMEIPEKAIPPALLAGAQGIAVIPDVIKVGLVVGGQFGNGVLLLREKDGSWGNPVFVTLTSGSVGWQIGAQATDFVIVFKSARSVEGILKGKYILGADASAAAGPVGRRVEASTDSEFKAEIYSYSRSRGLFAGVSLEGSSLQIDHESNAAFYGKGDVRPSGILEGKDVKIPPDAEKLKKTLEKYAPAGMKK